MQAPTKSTPKKYPAIAPPPPPSSDNTTNEELSLIASGHQSNLPLVTVNIMSTFMQPLAHSGITMPNITMSSGINVQGNFVNNNGYSEDQRNQLAGQVATEVAASLIHMFNSLDQTIR